MGSLRKGYAGSAASRWRGSIHLLSSPLVPPDLFLRRLHLLCPWGLTRRNHANCASSTAGFRLSPARRGYQQETGEQGERANRPGVNCSGSLPVGSLAGSHTEATAAPPSTIALSGFLGHLVSSALQAHHADGSAQLPSWRCRTAPCWFPSVLPTSGRIVHSLYSLQKRTWNSERPSL